MDENPEREDLIMAILTAKEILDIIKVNSIGVAFFLMAITAFKIGDGNFSRVVLLLFYLNVIYSTMIKCYLSVEIPFFHKNKKNKKNSSKNKKIIMILQEKEHVE